MSDHQLFMIRQALSEMAQSVSLTADHLRRPSVLYTPELSKRETPEDRVFWVASYGAVEGFGDTPEEAMRHFDKVWREGA